MKPVIVIGAVHHNTLGVIRALGRKGLSDFMYPIIVGKDDNYIAKSRYIHRKNLIIIKDLSILIETLCKLHFPSNEKAVVICCWDSAISLLDSNRVLLNDKYIIPEAVGRYGAIHSLMSKALQNKAAMESGLSVPRSFYYSKNSISQVEIESWGLYPCIIKPADSIVGTKAEIHICHNYHDLCQDIEKSNCQYFYIQQYIEKSMEYQLIGCSLSSGDEIIIPGYTNIIRQPLCTNTGFLKFQPIDENISSINIRNVENFIKAIGYSGLFSVEFLKDKDGTDYFLEINMRNDGNAICVSDAGVNLPFIWCAYNSGEDYKTEASNKCRSVFCMPEFDDVIFVLKGKLSPFRWINDIRRTTSFMEYSSDDKAPFYKKLKDFIVFLLKRALHI